jgi:nucleotide-binding universal stress UspA family protein
MLDIERILVPIDFSAASLEALDYAAEFSLPYEARLTILHVVEPDLHGSSLLGSDKILAQKEQELAETRLAELAQAIGKRGIDCNTLVRFGVAHTEILASARQTRSNLIILSTHGRTGLAHALIGSVAEHVVREATCPVLTVRNKPG